MELVYTYAGNVKIIIIILVIIRVNATNIVFFNKINHSLFKLFLGKGLIAEVPDTDL